MLDEQSAKIFAAICGSLDDVEQGRSNIEHITYGVVGKKGERNVIHIIIVRTPPYEEEDDEDDEDDEVYTIKKVA